MLDLLRTRQSVGIKHLAEPGPDDAQLAAMAEAALRAPDHAGLVPFRFAVVRGTARERLAALFQQSALDAGKDAAGAALDAERARRAPVTVAVIARLDPGHPQVPVHEQWACLGGALTNLLNAASALGFGGKMLSGAKVRHPAIQAAFCRPGEQLVGWVALGTPVGSPQRTLDKPRAADVIGDWPELPRP
ncbi:nitroreductase family protein [Aquincola sp. S2]|uniref:Putative NAD(P)H nitroreductase n=2 Tax=Pseudaquabacterium terrae TaxID=2732868 RepID=A0ABX2EQ73_9BURK|nr:nitroreductase family protein [Aquabacterium terrae]NRF70847.1 nitroreductase family protein [Aquabacterium terrae]